MQVVHTADAIQEESSYIQPKTLLEIYDHVCQYIMCRFTACNTVTIRHWRSNKSDENSVTGNMMFFKQLGFQWLFFLSGSVHM